jgi:hypothetical protein
MGIYKKAYYLSKSEIKPDIEPMLFKLKPYIVCIITQTAVENQFMDSLAEILVRSGCRSMHALGPGACEWDDMLDDTVLYLNDYNRLTDDQKIMTTFSLQQNLSRFIYDSIYTLNYSDLVFRNIIFFDFSTPSKYDDILQELEFLEIPLSIFREHA